MAYQVVRHGDGFRRQSPHLRGEVRRLQAALNKAGYPGDTDGLFGEATEQLVKAFQSDRGLSADGVVGANPLSARGQYPISTYESLTPCLPKNRSA